jgi:elongation factor 2
MNLVYSTIDNVNVVIAIYTNPKGPMGNIEVSPTTVTVCFGSGLYGFELTLAKFAKIYSSRFGIAIHTDVSEFWGD